MSKRMREDDDELLWRVTFDQTQSLRTLVEVVGNILTRVNFRITYDAKRELHFLCIDSIDPSHVCMIQARLVCENASKSVAGDLDFCVDSSILNLILKNIPTHYSLHLEKRRDRSDIFLRAYETLSNSHSTLYELPTLVDDSESMQLNDMDYRYTVEIDLGLLRQIVKMSMSLRAQQLEFSVEEPTSATDGLTQTAFTIASTGDAKQAHHFQSATVTEGTEARVIRAATDSTTSAAPAGPMRRVYHDSFSAQYLSYFLKSMERQVITMRFSQDKPLLVHYELGADKSYICFVLAPKTSEG